MQKIAFFLYFLLFVNFLYTQESPENQKDIKIGLVLSGGGAKGLAHIGALKVLEEAGIRPDYIGGTSMGAIIGALYASGYSADQLDSIFRATDLINLIQDNLPRSAKSFYEKEDSERYAVTLPFNNFKITIPQGFSGGQNIYNELVRLLYHVKDVDDFSKLPIPFLCIATDVETGKAVLLNKGYLPEAILASGTLPSLFGPVEIDDQVLIDGGVVNNYPIEEIKKLGMDVIIGVDVQHALRDREDLLSATEILLQINNFRTVQDMVQKAKMTDIYIRPKVEDFSVISFNFTSDIIKTGEAAAKEKYDDLKNIAMKQRKHGNPSKVHVTDSLTIIQMILEGNDDFTRAYIKGKLRFELDEKITFEKLQQGIGNLAATGNFRVIRYRLVEDGSETDLILNLRENPNKTFIRMGLNYNDLYKSAVLLNLTKKNVLMKDDVGSVDFILGDNLRYNFQYYVDKGLYWSFGINSRFNAFSKDISYDFIRLNFEEGINSNINRINLDVTDITNQVYLQTVLKEEFAFILGVEHKFLKYSSRTISQLINEENQETENLPNERTFFEKSNYFSAYSQLILDTYDDKFFPSKGVYFGGDFHYYILSSDFNTNFKDFSISTARMGTAFPLANKLSMNIEASGGFKLGTSRVGSFDFVLGGFGTDMINSFIPFFGYDFLSLPGNSFVKAYTKLDYEIAPKNHLMFAANFANVEDDLFRTGEWFTTPSFSGYGLGYGLESFLGPIQVMYSFSPQRKSSNLFFSLGYWF